MRLYNEDFIAILICFSQDLSLLFYFCFMDIVLMIINVIHMHIITKHDAILLLNSFPSESHRQDKKAILWNNMDCRPVKDNTSQSLHCSNP